MFRLIPFKSLSNLDYTNCDVHKLYNDCLSKNSVFIQDTDDMVVEKFTLDQLHDFELNDKVSYEGFSIAESYVEPDESLLLQREVEFLGGDLVVDCYVDDCIESILNIKYKGKKFKLVLSENRETKDLVLLVNNHPIALLGKGITSWFSLVQVCKTKSGFDFVLHLSDIECYIGFSLSKDLKLVKFVDLDYYIERFWYDNSNYKGFSVKPYTLTWNTSYLSGVSSFSEAKVIITCDYMYDKNRSWLSTSIGSLFNCEEDDIVEKVFGMEFKFNKFTLTLTNWYDSWSRAGLVLLSINDKPLFFLDADTLISDTEAFFRLVQICKTKNGFDIKFKFKDYEKCFTVCLSKDLKLIEFKDLDNLIDKKLSSTVGNIKSEEDCKKFFAKHKLLGNLGDLNV